MEKPFLVMNIFIFMKINLMNMNMNKIITKTCEYEYKSALIFIFISIGEPYPLSKVEYYEVQPHNVPLRGTHRSNA